MKERHLDFNLGSQPRPSRVFARRAPSDFVLEYPRDIARRCTSGSAAAIRDALGVNREWLPEPPVEFLDEVLNRLGERGLVEVIEIPLLC